MYYKYLQGMILPFDTACPTGWTRVSILDDKFLRGSETYDGTGGGTSSHTHVFDPASSTTSHCYVHNSDKGDIEYSLFNTHYHPIDIAATTSGSADHIPSYVNVVFCKKD